jgi:hypothetical protein
MEVDRALMLHDCARVFQQNHNQRHGDDGEGKGRQQVASRTQAIGESIKQDIDPDIGLRGDGEGEAETDACCEHIA